MNAQQDSGDNGTWVRAHTGREENEPLTSAWANVHLSHPQPEQSYGHQSFFADGMDYHPEEAALFIPPSSHPGPVPRSMEALTTSFAPQNTPENNASTAIRPLQTNVDAAQYGHDFQEGWRKASLGFLEDEDEDAPSPALTEASSHGPFTPIGFDLDCGGLSEAGMRQLTHDMSSSYGSLSVDPLEGMFKDVTVGSILAFDPWEISRACRTTAANQASMGFQYGPLGSNSLAGLPMLAARSRHHPFASDEKPSLSQGRFRDSDGLPTEATTIFSEHTCRRATAQLSIAPTVTQSSTSRKARDQYLLDMREKGFTYKEIKETGDFDEAESTLRGRVRVLTKARSERVRKPEWTARDVRLLRRGVAFVSRQPAVNGNRRRRTGKLPWKDISAYIREHGGTYSFAPATCAKKWEEVSGEE